MLPGFVNSSDEEEQKKKSSHNRKKDKKSRKKEDLVSGSSCSTEAQVSDLTAQVCQDNNSMMAGNIGAVGDQENIVSDEKKLSDLSEEMYLAQGARPKRTSSKYNLPKMPTEQQPVGGADSSVLGDTLSEIYLMQGAKPKKSCDSSFFQASIMQQYSTDIGENIPVDYDVGGGYSVFPEHTQGVVQQSIPDSEDSNMPLQEMTAHFQRLSVSNITGANTRVDVTGVGSDPLKRVRHSHIGHICSLGRRMFYRANNGCYQIRDEIMQELLDSIENVDYLVNLLKVEIVTQLAIALGFNELACALICYQIDSLNMYALNMIFYELMNIVSCDSRSSMLTDRLYDVFVPYADTSVVNSGGTSSSGVKQYSALVVMLSELLAAKKNTVFSGDVVYYVNFAIVSCYYRLGCMYHAIGQYFPDLQSVLLQDPLGDMKQRCVDTCCGMVYMYYIGPEYNNAIKYIKGVAFPSLLLDICNDQIIRHFAKSIKQARKLNFSYVTTSIASYIIDNLQEDFLLSIEDDIVKYADILKVIAGTTADQEEEEEYMFQVSKFGYGR
ncbi:DUF3514 domain-containing protein [Ehrlichia ruminantium]|uniref:DUF3514 domain-containing protein n=1 Tax=Ehrlichia ruminantium TaxID=779 RepID=UPI001FB22845|nr:DUF3514 domain-containing protein [Ehrlichia ruminantium]UOD98854.1 DUF3514 domain-containing protein [Ehrlichia ruminantium]